MSGNFIYSNTLLFCFCLSPVLRGIIGILLSSSFKLHAGKNDETDERQTTAVPSCFMYTLEVYDTIVVI